MKISVSPSLNIYPSLTYDVPERMLPIEKGARVIIPMGQKIDLGWVTEIHSDYKGKTKAILGIVENEWIPGPQEWAFVNNVSEKYRISRGWLLDHFLHPGRKAKKDLWVRKGSQQKRLTDCKIKDINGKSKGDFPLFSFKKRVDVTSGIPSQSEERYPSEFLISAERFERYPEIAGGIIESGGSVIITVGDKLTQKYLAQRLPDADIYNSALRKSERERLWEKYQSGTAGIVIGTLSALCLPIRRIGAVIYETGAGITHQSTFLNRPKDLQYMSMTRGQDSGARTFVGASSLPIHKQVSVETLESSSENPNWNILPLKKDREILFDTIKSTVLASHREKKKTLVIINSIQTAYSLYCFQCKKAIKCKNCGKYPYLKSEDDQKCNFCGVHLDSICPKCSGQIPKVPNLSISSVESHLKSQVTSENIVTLTAAQSAELDTLRQRIDRAEIVIATPFLISPPFYQHFDTLLMLKPESVFDMSSHYSAEHLYSLLRSAKQMVRPEGSLHLISLFHFHYALKLVDNERGFFDRELKYRQWFMLPPHYAIYQIELKDRDRRSCAAKSRKLLTAYSSLEFRDVHLESIRAVRGYYKIKMDLHIKDQDSAVLNEMNERWLTIKLKLPDL